MIQGFNITQGVNITQSGLNGNYSVGIYVTSNDNIFSNNTLFNAQDSVGSNYWDYEKSGNYWDDYNLSDDKGYVISNSGIDNYPIKNLTDISWYENYFDIR